jgi:hypothetical protein
MQMSLQVQSHLLSFEFFFPRAAPRKRGEHSGATLLGDFKILTDPQTTIAVIGACPLLREMPRCHHALPSQKTGLIQSRFSGFRNLITKLSRGEMCLVTSWFFVRYVPREKATFLRRAAGHTRQHASRTSIPGLSISQNDGFYSLQPIILFVNTDISITRYV